MTPGYRPHPRQRQQVVALAAGRQTPYEGEEMSLQTWIDEFYPVPANEVPEKHALGHSIIKWIGLQPENLARHNVVRSGRDVYGSDADRRLSIDDETCALCRFHIRPRYGLLCKTCPLHIAIGGFDCDDGLRPAAPNPYGAFVDGDPAPMLEWQLIAQEQA
jgi:hypothetical protein